MRGGLQSDGPVRIRQHEGPVGAERRPAPKASRPFDRGPRWVRTLAEGAGILVLEELRTRQVTPAPTSTPRLLGYGASGDGGHITQPQPRGQGRGARHVPGVRRRAASTPDEDRLHQRSRNQHAAGRQGRDNRHQERVYGDHAYKLSGVEHQEPPRPLAGRQRAASRRSLRSRRSTTGVVPADDQSTTRPTPTATSTTRPTPPKERPIPGAT